MSEVIVIGGGIVGASVAYRLAKEGARVTLLEAGRLGGGTTIASFAWVNSHNKPPIEYHRLNVSGMGEHYALRDEFGVAPWLHIDGHVEWDRSEGGKGRIREKVARLREWGYQAEILPVAELRAFEPDMVAPPDVDEFAYFSAEGYIDPVLLIGHLAGAARDLGARIRTQSRVTGFIRSGARVVGVELAGGERLMAATVVSCVGRWTDELADLAGIRMPLAPKVGMIIVSAPSAVRLRSIHHDESMNIRPDGAGRVIMRHYDFDDMVRPDTPTQPIPALCYDMLARVVEILPGLAGTPIEAARIAVRPIPGDGLSVVGPAPDTEGLYLVCTHSAATMGPWLGRIVAREIMHGDMDPRIAPFRPERLVAPAIVAGGGA